jgi:class 3 adenylate cyclase/tetratricopeptide (TPR) repeat protein
VSVLFADLVGFTTLSEGRDAEEVRELLSSYFEAARRVIGRYGGTVEKFIGDAVMAVWGAPVAQEDDAERAVRTALDLVGEIEALGGEAGIPELRLRAGVVTGEAAVTVGAEGQGMVAGDLVNTASRVQSLAAPGAVLVGEATRRLSDAAIAYDDAGEHELKGKADAVHLWRALRVIANRRGAGRFSGLEPPFVGRDAELRLVKELFHATADEGAARVVSVIGIPGIGKSRLAWEFDKYTDGLIDDIWWHTGRCLAYGEGVAYWALSEMLRMRTGIVEDEEPDAARTKLHASVEKHVAEPEERAWIEPRLAHLLGLAERIAPDQQDLFSAWRRFFELMAEEGPVVLLFEDLHWADAALLDFIEYLLDWSRNYPIFVLTLARPELLERRPTWGAGKRNFHSLVLEPLPDDARDELLAGLVPGLPGDVRARIGERAEGVPLYAVETVRMLLDRGVLEQVDDEFRLTREIDVLDVPDTLQALIAARLDGLPPVERRLLEDASVLGKTFTAAGLADVATLPEPDVEAHLTSLVRKEILDVERDSRSPERGQFGFLHALVQKVAYDTLSRKERKARHLAVAEYLEREWGPDDAEIVEVVASHYLAAFRAAPDSDDAATIKAKACDRLTRAAERAASLAANEDAHSRYLEAAELADDPARRAELLERAGETARAAGRFVAAAEAFEQAVELFDAAGETHPAARATARLGGILYEQGRIDEGIERMEQAFGVLASDEPDGDLAALAHELARLYLFAGNAKLHYERVEFALEIAEALELPDIVAEALNTKSVLYQARPHESGALMREALRVALDHDLTNPALRAYNNLAYLLGLHDQFEDAGAACADGIALARRSGHRNWEWILQTNLSEALYQAGEWDRALEIADDLPDEARVIGFGAFPSEVLFWISAYRGEHEVAREMAALTSTGEDSNDLQVRGIALLVQARLGLTEGRAEDAVRLARSALEPLVTYGSPYLNEGVAALVDTALEANEIGILEEGLARTDGVLPSKLTLRAHRARANALLAARAGASDRVEPAFKAAEASFHVARNPFWLAVTHLDHAGWLIGTGRADEAAPLLVQARETFDRLRARPYVDRAVELERRLEPATA